MKFDAADLRATIDGRVYEWRGGFGAVLVSVERGVKQNDVRMIGDVIFYAYRVSTGGLFWQRVCWCPQGNIDAEWLKSCKAAIFR